MNSALRARTRPGFYDDYVKFLREGGASKKDIDRIIAKAIVEAQMLLNGKCPKCGAPSARYFDANHQHGGSSLRGTWFMYRCSTQPPPGQRRNPDGCDFMMDLLEAE